MGLFNKIKDMFSGTEKGEKKVSDEQVVEKNSNESNIKVYEKGLSKSRKGFVSKLADLTNKYSKITDEYFDELEEILIMADIGVNTVMEFIDRLRDRVRHENITDPSELKEIIVDELFIIYVNDEVLSNKIKFNENGPTVILFVGVNGVGKTTTIGKLANKFKDDGKKVLLVGADTFRAGAVEQLKEWSTGFTPLSGVMMGTRSGDIDPSIIPYVMEHEGKNVGEVIEDLNQNSGLLGLSKCSSDMRDIIEACDNGDNRALVAKNKFVRRVVDYIAQYYALLGGVDVIAFTAGIGENSVSVRREICERLSCFGVKIDLDLNTKRGELVKISTDDSSVDVYIIPTDEELMIANEAYKLIVNR